MMEVIIDKNTTIDKEKLIIESLELSLKEDKARDDKKSIKYHVMALEKHKKVLFNLENTNKNEIEMERLWYYVG